jgi:hypothetical protein
MVITPKLFRKGLDMRKIFLAAMIAAWAFGNDSIFGL